MPELPDLQIFSKNLKKELKGIKIKKINLVDSRSAKSPASAFKKSLQGAKVKDIYREGKEIHILFDNGQVLGLHMMLHGKLAWFHKKNENKHTLFELYFDNGTGLALTDFQKKAAPTLNPGEKDAPDALSKEVNYKFLSEQLSKKKTNIKNFLMDQKIIRGIGNAYADEILWEARIAPRSITHKIPDAAIKSLVKSIKSVLKAAEKQIAKTHPDIISGEVRDFLKIHNADKEKSPKGAKISHEMLNSRITYYTKEQKVYR